MTTPAEVGTRAVRLPVEGAPSALVGVDFDVECPFPGGGVVHTGTRAVMGVLPIGSEQGPRAVRYLCLTCWTCYLYQPKYGVPTPVRVEPVSDRRVQEEEQVEEVKGRLVRNVMAKRMKNKQCALCREPFVRKVSGLKFCEPHALAAEEVGLG